jgi:hypothetical protein
MKNDLLGSTTVSLAGVKGMYRNVSDIKALNTGGILYA